MPATNRLRISETMPAVRDWERRLSERLERIAHVSAQIPALDRLCFTFGGKKRQKIIAGPLLIITGISALLGISIVAILFQQELAATFLFLFTSMPRFDVLDVSGESDDFGNSLYYMYSNFRTISFFVLSIAIVIAGLSFGMETVNLVPPELGSKILGNGILYLIIIMVFPHFWDMTANIIEWTSLWILNPADPSMAHTTVAALLSYMSPGVYPQPDYAQIFGSAGAVITDTVFSAIVDTVTGQGGDGALAITGEGYQRTITAFLTEVMLFFLKAMALLTMSLTAFLLGTVRYVLTGLLAVGVPLILALSLIPQFGRVTGLMRDTLIALMIVPIFSALAVSAGVAILTDLESGDFGVIDVAANMDAADSDCSPEDGPGGSGDCEDAPAMIPPPTVQELTYGVRKFFMALAVLVLAIYFPAMLAPMISNVMSSVQQHVSTTGITGGIMASGMSGAISYSGVPARAGIKVMRGAGERVYDMMRYGRRIAPRDQAVPSHSFDLLNYRTPKSQGRGGPEGDRAAGGGTSAKNDADRRRDTGLKGKPRVPKTGDKRTR